MEMISVAVFGAGSAGPRSTSRCTVRRRSFRYRCSRRYPLARYAQDNRSLSGVAEKKGKRGGSHV